jgi:AraC family transcriptional regulator, transcriptional activator of pobA
MDDSGKCLYDSNMIGPTTRHRVVDYALFGEAQDLPELLHCESIAARSALHDWEFAPHRHPRLHQVLLLEVGAGTALLDGQRHPIEPGSVVNVPAGTIHGFAFERGTEGWVVTLARGLVDELVASAQALRGVAREPAIVAADATVRAPMASIAREHAGRAAGRGVALRAQAALLLVGVARRVGAGAGSGPAPVRQHLARFEALLDAHFLEHWGVSDYARALHITPTQLSRLARAATGRSASALIDARVAREARRNLVYTNLPVSSIAYALGFRDAAYFTRVFRRATGLAPSAFRAGQAGTTSRSRGRGTALPA